MDGRIRNLEESGDYIWLRYATQFSAGGRTHTIEMSIPMPLGASDEVRAQLLDEAEQGMEQLMERVEQRVTRIVQRVQSGQGRITPAAPNRPASPQTRPAVKPASSPAPQTASQPLASPGHERSTEQVQRPSGDAVSPAARTPLASTPHDMGISNDDSGGNLPLPEFLQYIKENLGLNSKQAMDLLKVKSLSSINRREALAQLLQIVGHGSPGAGNTASNPPRQGELPPGVTYGVRPAQDSSPQKANSPVHPSNREVQGSPKDISRETTRPPVREEGPIYIFDEEVAPEEDGSIEDELEDLEDEPAELSAQERAQARALLSKLRESRGATSASPNRLQVLHNVTDTQVEASQLQELVEGVWGVNSLKKLKVDQVEVLISWAKEDDFASEVSAVLTLLAEDSYARGHR